MSAAPRRSPDTKAHSHSLADRPTGKPEGDRPFSHAPGAASDLRGCALTVCTWSRGGFVHVARSD
eukprot:6959658-Prymnesium_polylepis.1